MTDANDTASLIFLLLFLGFVTCVAAGIYLIIKILKSFF